MAEENQRAGETPAPPSDAELARARAAYQEAASTVFASGHDGGRGWPPEPWLHPLVAFERAARERTLDEVRNLRAALDAQKRLNAELHKGACSGYSDLLARARRMEDAIRFALSPESGFACPATTEDRLQRALA